MSNSSHPAPTTLVDDLIRIAAQAEDELEEALAVHRLSRPSYLVLQALEQAPDQTLIQRDLVQRVGRTAGTMSIRLTRLERAGLIDREPDPANRRSVAVTLTDRGTAALGRASAAYQERSRRLIAPLGEPAAAQLAGALHTWRAFFDPGETGAPQLGVAVASAAVARRMREAVGLPAVAGVLILRVAGDSPAHAAGLARGDLVTAAQGDPVASIGDLQRAVGQADGVLALSVLRGADAREVTVTLSPRP